MKELLKKCLVECIGTFFLVFTVASAVMMGGEGVIPAISIGFILMVMVYAGGHISGGHYNPAVSLAAAIRGALPCRDLIPYWVAQVVGAICAAYLVVPFAGEKTFECCAYGPVPLILGEFLFTFALCYVVLMVATTKKTEGNSYYGLAIGSTVTVGAFAVGGIFCYGAFNPAVAVGLGCMHVACWVCLGMTIVANLVAGALAALVFKCVTTEE